MYIMNIFTKGEKNMSTGTKVLIIVLAVLAVIAFIVVRIVRKVKRKVKATLNTVDRAGEYAGRILRIAGKVKNGETGQMLRDIAEDFKLSEVKALISSEDKLDAILDLIETEADAEEADEVKISEAVLNLKDMVLSRKK